MASTSILLKKVAILELLLVSTLVFNIAPCVNAKISCEQVTILLIPCIGYAVAGGVVLPSCCEGIKQSLALVKTKQDLRDKCHCVQDGAARIPGLSYERVNELPALCGTTSPYVVSPKTNCDRLG